MIFKAVPAAGEAPHDHSRRDARLDAERAVLDDEAAPGRHADSFGRMKENVRCRLAVGHVLRRVDVLADQRAKAEPLHLAVEVDLA